METALINSTLLNRVHSARFITFNEQNFQIPREIQFVLVDQLLFPLCVGVKTNRSLLSEMADFINRKR